MIHTQRPQSTLFANTPGTQSALSGEHQHHTADVPTLDSGVVTLTAAPVIDRSYRMARLETGSVNRAALLGETFSGKGINLSLNLQTAGFSSGAVFPLARDEEELIAAPFRARDGLAKITRHSVQVHSATRVNCVLIEDSGRTTNINQFANRLSETEWQDLCRSTIKTLRETKAGWLVIAGTLPINTDTGELVELGGLLKAANAISVKVCLDTSGATLKRWMASDLVELIAPNIHELMEALNLPIEADIDTSQLLNVALELGINNILLTLGADGMIFANHNTRLWSRADAKQLVNTTGAGDAALSGFFSQLPAHTPLAELNNYALADAVLRAASWGAHTVAFEAPRAPNFVDAPPARLLTQFHHRLAS